MKSNHVKETSNFNIENALIKVQTTLDVHGIGIEELKENLLKLSNIVSYMLGDIFKLKQKVDEINIRTINFPQLYNNVDALIVEIKEYREERAFMNKRISNLENNCSKNHLKS